MSRDYAKVAPTYWSGDTGRELRAEGGRNAQLLGLYLLSCPHGNSFGLYRLPKAYIEADLDLDRDDIDAAFMVMARIGFAQYDTKTETVFVTNMAAAQIAETLKPNDKRLGWVTKEVAKLSRMWLFPHFLARYRGPWALAIGHIEAPSIPLVIEANDNVKSLQEGGEAPYCGDLARTCAYAHDPRAHAYSGSGSGSGSGRGSERVAAPETPALSQEELDNPVQVAYARSSVRGEYIRKGYDARFRKFYAGRKPVVKPPREVSELTCPLWSRIAAELEDEAAADVFLDRAFAHSFLTKRGHRPSLLEEMRVEILAGDAPLLTPTQATPTPPPQLTPERARLAAACAVLESMGADDPGYLDAVDEKRAAQRAVHLAESPRGQA